MAEAAPHITPGQLADLAAVVKAAAAPEDAEAAAKKNRANQKLNISRTFDGMYRLDGWLDTEAGAEVAAAIDAFTRKRDPNLSIARRPDRPAPRRSPASRWPVTAMDHAESCNGNPSPRHSLIVAISLEALMTGIGSADIQGHGPITAGAARRLACEYGIIPAVLGTESQILDLGVPNRLATPKQRFNIALRDGGCLFPGCDLPAVPLRRAPPTALASTAARPPNTTSTRFCTFHHHQVHEGGWTYKIIDADTLEFYPPGGGPPITQQTPQVPRPNLNKRLNPEPRHIQKPRRT